ncbi:MAG: hypothetical protein AAGH46_11740, partial [Bacteroidota bacterium]
MSVDKLKSLTHHTMSNGEHWFNYEAYGKNQIASIKDPEAGDTVVAPTSIPSPFAAIDLVRGAFNRVGNNGFEEGTRIDFKLISDCLDLGELLFDADILRFDPVSKREILQIILWDKDNDLKRLINSNNEGHRRLGEVLKLYLDQDAQVYNFDKFEQLFIVKYKNHYLGGISPSTLFFTSANDHSIAQIRRPNGAVLFDDNYTHLYDRDEDYQLFLYALQLSMPNFNRLYKEFGLYLEQSKKELRKINLTLCTKIEELKKEHYNTHFDHLQTSRSKKNVTLLNEFTLRKRKGFASIDTGGEVESDFEIASSKYLEKIKPLVLKREHDGIATNGDKMIYYSYPYTKDIGKLIPIQNPISYEEREMPGISGIKYPNLLLDDFLQPYLVKLVFPINNGKYFDGNYAKSKLDRGFLIPIKERYFDFFDVDDLINGTTKDGKHYFEFQDREGGVVNAILRVPVKKGYITFERQYFPSAGYSEPEPEISIEKNKGALIERHFTVSVFPFIRCLDEEIEPDYRVLVVDCDDLPETRGNDYELSFVGSRNKVFSLSSEI